MNVNNIYLLDHQQIPTGNGYRNINSTSSIIQMKSDLQNDSNAEKVIFKVESDHFTSGTNLKISNHNQNLTSCNNYLSAYGSQTNCLKSKSNESLVIKECEKTDVQKDNDEMDMSVPNSLNIYVNNVVCSYSTRCHLNLRRIAMEGMHVEYKKENGMVNMKLRKPYTTATMWSSGKITCAGAKSEADAYKAARRFCRLLQKMQFKVKMTNYRVVNVLATCNMPFGVDIQRLAETHQKECSYEPELHPGATFKLIKLKATLKLFTTGSITLTAPSVLVAREAINQIYPILMEFKRAIPHEQPNAQIQMHFNKPEPNLLGINNSYSNNSFNQNLNNSSSIKQEMITQRPPVSTISSNLNYYNNPQQIIKTTTKLIPNNVISTSFINNNNNNNNNNITTSSQKISHVAHFNTTTTIASPSTTLFNTNKTNITIHKSNSTPNIVSPTNNQVYQLNVPSSYHQIIPANSTVSYNQSNQQQQQNSNLYALNQSSHINNSTIQGSSMSFPVSNSMQLNSNSSLISANPYGSNSLSQSNSGWYFDNLLVDNVDDFLP